MIFNLHIADSFFTRMRGLSRHKTLAHNDGLMIQFPFPFFWPIWMRGMQFPIDVLWLRHGKIVDMCEALLPENPYRMHFPMCCADACVELNMGAIQNHQLSIGSLIEFQIVNLEV
jgi:uncharacterized membrane protein (UPF0127 family)